MKKRLRLLLLGDAWFNLAIGMLGPIYALYVAEIGGDLLDASWAHFVYMISAGVTLYFVGLWENRIQHKYRLIIVAYGLTGIGSICYIFVYNQLTLLLTQIVLGLAYALLAPAFDTLYATYTTKKNATGEWGLYEAMSYIVTALAAIIGGYLTHLFGFNALFLTMCAFSIFGMITAMHLK